MWPKSLTVKPGVSLVLQEAELHRLSQAREEELNYKKKMDGLEVEKQKQLAEIESHRFSQMVSSLGSDTLKDMARAGPELQVGHAPPGHWPRPSRLLPASDWLSVLSR